MTRSGLHFDKHERLAVPRHDVQLAAAHTIPPCENRIPAPLEFLARELGRTGEDDLALFARVLAWSEPEPERDASVALTGEVRETVLMGTNGRPS